MSDPIDLKSFKDKLTSQVTESVETPVEEAGPVNATFRITTKSNPHEPEDATGILVTTSAFVGVGAYSKDGTGMNFELVVPMENILVVNKLF